ncbi:UDP-GlcNAc:betaGal beta-1,3-N-acetylglucosaminyltransferase-like protein 1 isoform X1 [Esox lucius]|uniref:UDP-GlcNAc:betaGal beta-1,3-N-acetylglucosaminyltransferase-like protein 1 isoform X1 n=1 Tax=Esox lucius TaxID=8010 RepID=UPI001476B8EB|nr:UDP-GlcNAc:betaGal beta-1,3-N-acetylglucosaminyltransferase-like protein 1 isoform X1 [Esox lucius]XP_028978148.2 UDP-GlcNAc:betaGal beta-1,3-N-acetylglucosaminyltransferase-like protein 1 isoform X1 [Esox lucius]XP_028978149.2 UDP-GlcNAc:betaGal beta-1,3-N-acetylglucosaminyltransferase-like protein 1 isoform X1 [Esox lucius]XP_028978150.2 UDP-GlcNAc:betaGal beta-1,3-N-acetylglucosaminyltransferase-like protein 1 isoform X1 [Esox lucius]XP_034150341.1 UDP-GlcNAc:betaGal beta-1,3-N-acetylgluc
MSACSLECPNRQEGVCVPAKRLCLGSVDVGVHEPDKPVDVSIVMPVHNATCWLDECLQGILNQDFTGSMELSVYDDASTDGSRAIVEGWRERLERRGVSLVISSHDSTQPRGVGYAKNRAVGQSSGEYLCFQDADDMMMPQRIRLQYEACLLHKTSLIGCQVRRDPEGSTERYTRWINNVSQEQLATQVYTSHGPTVIMPTWFCSRDWFQRVGNFDEGGKGVPEDLLFFYRSVAQGGGVVRVDQCLLVYRYHQQAATHTVLEETIWNHRVAFLQERVINQWKAFTIWNAGKQGRKLYRSLTHTNQKKVTAFCDVDENKIKKGFYTYEDSKVLELRQHRCHHSHVPRFSASQERPKPKIPVLHYKDAAPPYIICVKLDMTCGVFEENLKSLSLKEGVDYHHFN